MFTGGVPVVTLPLGGVPAAGGAPVAAGGWTRWLSAAPPQGRGLGRGLGRLPQGRQRWQVAGSR